MALRSVNVESLGLKAPLSHAVEVDPGDRLLFLSGLTAKADDGSTFAPGDVGAQTRRILESVREILERAGERWRTS